jgi:hypothetical protein
MTTIGSKSIDPYTISCICCSTQLRVLPVTQHNSAGYACGFFFVCSMCKEGLLRGETKIDVKAWVSPKE